MTREGDPLFFFFKLEGKLRRGSWTIVGQVWGYGEKGEEKAGKIRLLLASVLLPNLLTLDHWRLEGILQSLMNFLPLFAFPSPPWSVTFPSPAPRKNKRGVLTFGASVHTEQGLATTLTTQRQAWELCFVEWQHLRSRKSRSSVHWNTKKTWSRRLRESHRVL